MALTQIDYPVTGILGAYNNMFPSQKPIYSNFNRKDREINSIVSGVDGKVRINVTIPFIDIVLGQYITFATDSYLIDSHKVISLIDASTIEIDLPFTSTNVSNNFLNYYRNYYLELRYVNENSAGSDQNAIEIISDYTQVSNSKNGNIKANISLPSQLINPDFDIATGVNTDLFKSYKIQFRESYEGNRADAWASPILDIKILLVHASISIEANQFTDETNTQRFIKGYPLLHSLLYSDVNDSGSNSLSIELTEYDISQNVIATNVIDTVLDMNGVYLLRVDTDTFDANTVFIEFDSILSSDNSQYDGTQYDGTQYA